MNKEDTNRTYDPQLPCQGRYTYSRLHVIAAVNVTISHMARFTIPFETIGKEFLIHYVCTRSKKGILTVQNVRNPTLEASISGVSDLAELTNVRRILVDPQAVSHSSPNKQTKCSRFREIDAAIIRPCKRLYYYIFPT